MVGVDIDKEVFHLVGLDTNGKIALRRKIRRLSLKDAFEQLPPCIVGMEACLSAHFVSRVLRALGHEPRIIPAIYTKRFVKGYVRDGLRYQLPMLLKGNLAERRGLSAGGKWIRNFSSAMPRHRQ